MLPDRNVPAQAGLPLQAWTPSRAGRQCRPFGCAQCGCRTACPLQRSQKTVYPNRGEMQLLPPHLRKGLVWEEARLVAGQGQRQTKGMWSAAQWECDQPAHLLRVLSHSLANRVTCWHCTWGFRQSPQGPGDWFLENRSENLSGGTKEADSNTKGWWSHRRVSFTPPRKGNSNL